MAVTYSEAFWKRIAIAVSLFAFIATAGVIMTHQQREKIQKQTAAQLSGKVLTISSQSKNDLVALMNKERSIVAVSVVSISLVSNRRQVTFFQSEIPEMQANWETYTANRKKLSRVFGEDKYQNTRITSIINGNFECRATAETAIGGQFNAESFAPTICSIAVPPSFDKSADFVGFISFFIVDYPLTDSEQSRLAKEAIVLSNAIYARDISEE